MTLGGFDEFGLSFGGPNIGCWPGGVVASFDEVVVEFEGARPIAVLAEEDEDEDPNANEGVVENNLADQLGIVEGDCSRDDEVDDCCMVCKDA